ncbi:hypothetical protein CDD83_2088 [Cordyceps sp. RAO-2017]|nr:hypothetical protein CDD83_2088 [Cordyceps sp. RAO-2017]
MESICAFEPFWKRSDVVSAAHDAIKDIRVRSLNIYLEKHKGESPPPLSVDTAISECLDTVKILFSDSKIDNHILKRIRDIGIHQHIDEMEVVWGVLAMWYSSAAPAVARDPLQGFHPSARNEVDDHGTEFEPWSRRFASKRHNWANLGIIAILMTSESWVPPVHPLLKAGSLISRSVTTFLFAASLIGMDMLEEPWAHCLELTRREEATKLFFRAVWSVTRENFDILGATTPGIEFGTTLDEVRVKSNGKSITTNLGRRSFYCPPFWHPVRKVPGSSWNKFLKNHRQPMFPESSSRLPGFLLQIPGSLRTLAQPFETYYTDLRSRFDEKERPRRLLSQEAKTRQFHRLAEATGSSYPNLELSEDTATLAEEPEQEYMYKVPMVKKPMTDLKGHLTFHFMNTLVRAWRFQEEPDEVDTEFYIMSFER